MLKPFNFVLQRRMISDGNDNDRDDHDLKQNQA